MRKALSFVALAFALACGGGGGDGGITGTSLGSVATVTVSPTTASVEVGSATTLQAQALDGSGRVLTDRSFVWTSSDGNIASVGSDGRVTGVTPGTAEIAANVEGKFAKATITVSTRAVATVELTPTAVQLLVGGRQQLAVRTRASDGSDLTGRPVVWTSSDGRVVAVDGTGMVTAIGAGIATVTATSEGRAASVAVTVQGVPVTSVAVTPSPDTLTVGQTTQLTAAARDASGNLLTGRTVTWTTADASIASVSSSGVVLALAPGSTNVVATVDGVAGTARLVVTPRPVGAVIVSPATSQLLIGQTVQLTTQVTDANGTLLTGRDVSFASSNNAVATVSASGLVTARANGTVTITATSEGKIGTARVDVALVPVATIDVQPSAPTVFIGDALQLQATLRDSIGGVLTAQTITWTSGAPNVASVSSAGRVSGLTQGTAVILASAGGKIAAVTVTVRPVPVAAIRITPAGGTIIVGNVLDLIATPVDAAGNALVGRVVTFSSADNSIATVSSTGRVTGVSPGTVQINVTSETVTAHVTVVVTPIPVASVSVSGVPAPFYPGNTAQLTATARASDGSVLTGRPVTWTSSDQSVATVSATGTLTAVAPGTATISAVAGGVTGTATVTVSLVPVASVTVNGAPSPFYPGNTAQLTATALAADGSVLTGRPVTWSSSDGSVATVAPNGVVTAVAPGTATISAVAGGVTGTASITVTQIPVASVVVKGAPSQLFEGASAQLSATALAADGSVITGRPVTWSTSDGSVATVSGTGLVTGVAPGSVTITATVGGVAGSASITIAQVPIASISVALGSGTLNIGQTTQAIAVARDASGNVLTGRPVTWSSSDNTVATVSPNGVVTAVSPGNVTITATNGSISGSSNARVLPAPVGTVTVSLASPSIVAGQSTQATAVVRDQLGNVVSNASVTWNSTQPGVATVSGSGVVTGVAAGTSTIQATAGGVTGSATMTVTPPAPTVASVTVTLGASSIAVGASTAATAVARDGSGNVVTGLPVAWTTSASSVASVSASGTVTGVGQGNATITATVGGVAGSANVSVTPFIGPVTSITVSLANPTVAVGGTTTATAVARDANGTVVPSTTIVWSSGNGSIATVTSSGVVTATGVGATSIQAATPSGNVSGQAVITVTPIPVASVQVALGTSSVATAQSTSATATLRDANGNILTGRAVTWTSSDPLIAVVNGTGNNASVTGVLPGTATITATSGGVSGQATITVTLLPVQTVSVSLGASIINDGSSTQATATTRISGGVVVTGRQIDWTSSNQNVATVSASGVVTGNGPGTATITATSEGKTGSATITVAGPVTTVNASPGTLNLDLSSSPSRTATVTATDRNKVQVPNVTFVWSVADPTVASISGTGSSVTVTARKAGNTSVTVRVGNISDVINVRVVP